MTRRRFYLDVPPRLLSADEISRIANARINGRLGVEDYRRYVSQLLGHIDAIEGRVAPPVNELTPPQLRPGSHAGPPLRVRPELPSPGSPAWAAHARRVQEAMAGNATTRSPMEPHSNSTAGPTSAEEHA